MNKKIFFVINSLQGGGAERVVSILAKRLHELQYKVSIVCLNFAKPVYPLPDNLEIVYLQERKGESFFLRIYYAVRLFIKLNYLMFNKRPDYIISFMTTANLWTGISSFFTRANYIVSERTTPDYTINRYNKLLQLFSGLIYSRAKAVVIPSRGIEECLRKNLNFNQLKNYHVIHNPINNEARPPAIKSVNDNKFILAVGRLSYEKGFDILITAFKKADLPSEIQLLIVGEGPEKETLTRQIISLNLQERVKLLGFKKNIHDYYAQAQFFVLSSRNEGYPNALIEAMSMGCACIAMDCEYGPSEIIKHQHNGLLVADENMCELSAAIKLLHTNAVLKAKLTKNAKFINKTNSLDSITSQWEAILK